MWIMHVWTALLSFSKPKNTTIAVPTTPNALSLNLCRDVEVTREEVIGITVKLARRMDIFFDNCFPAFGPDRRKKQNKTEKERVKYTPRPIFGDGRVYFVTK